MAARLNRRYSDEIRAKIQTSQLINRLQKHIDGELELSSTQIDAAKFLINKTLSNAPTQIEQSIEGEIMFGEVRRVVTDAHNPDA